MFEGFDKYEMTFVAVTEKEFEESDARGTKVVAVKGGVVANDVAHKIQRLKFGKVGR